MNVTTNSEDDFIIPEKRPKRGKTRRETLAEVVDSPLKNRTQLNMTMEGKKRKKSRTDSVLSTKSRSSSSSLSSSSAQSTSTKSSQESTLTSTKVSEQEKKATSSASGASQESTDRRSSRSRRSLELSGEKIGPKSPEIAGTTETSRPTRSRRSVEPEKPKKTKPSVIDSCSDEPSQGSSR